MDFETAIKSIHPPKGINAIFDAAFKGDFSSLKEPDGLNSDYDVIAQKITEHQKQMDECKSDSEYWPILADLEYWKAVRNIRAAAGLIGGDKLPDIPLPNLKGCVVMDAIGKVKDFGELMLSEAKKALAP